MIRIAGYEDLKDLLYMAKEFTEESGWGWKFNAENAVQSFIGYIQTDEADVLIGDGSWAIVCFDNDFHADKVGYIVKFYVSKRKRGTGEGRKLVEACNAWFDKIGCKDSFVTATGNIESQGKAFQNLMKKNGYKDCGEAMVRR